MSLLHRARYLACAALVLAACLHVAGAQDEGTQQEGAQQEGAQHEGAQHEGGGRLDVRPGGSGRAVGSCAPQTWPREALRYEIEGIVQVGFRIGADGRATAPVIQRSSGWALLDQASLDMVRTCTYPPAQETTGDQRVPMQIVWTLEGDRIRPDPVPGTCQPMATIDGFQPHDNRPTDASGVKVRFLVDTGGKARGVRLEGNPDAGQADRILGYLDTCRFAFDPATPGERTDTVIGRVLWR